MARRTFAEIDGHARAHERTAARRHADVFCRGIDMAVTQGRLTADEASTTKAHVIGFADALIAGLHIEDHETPEIRRFTRLMLGLGGVRPGKGGR